MKKHDFESTSKKNAKEQTPEMAEREQEILMWMGDIRDDFILEAEDYKHYQSDKSVPGYFIVGGTLAAAAAICTAIFFQTGRNRIDHSNVPMQLPYQTEETKEIEWETEEETTEEATEEETTEVATEEEQDFRGLVIAQVNNYVNVRSIPSEDGEIVGKLYDKSVGEFEEEVNGWYKITSGNCTGYVKAEYCVTGDEAQALAKQVGTTYAVVNTTTLKVRQEASTESAVLGLVPIEEELVVVEELDGWVKVAIEEGDGYVSREYVNLRTDFVHAESKAEEEARLAEEAKSVRKQEQQQLQQKRPERLRRQNRLYRSRLRQKQ